MGNKANVNSSTISSPSAKSLPSNKRRECECGGQIEPIDVPLLGKRHWPSLCETCQKARRRAELQAERIAATRQRRTQRAVNMRKALERIIPPLYQNAHLRHLAKPLMDKLLQLPRDRGLLMYGPPGAGKTYSMCALARWYILNHYSARRITFERLCLDVRATFDSDGSEQVIIDELIKADVLFLEDVGTTTSLDKQESDFSLRTLLLILDERLEYCRPTFITSNKSVEQLAKSFDERIASRLHDCEIIQLQGKDRRRDREK